MINLGKDCEISLENLIATRMLINANSGGGKSWAIRRILEQSNGQIQQIVIDLEGEFSTLREKFDYLLVGKEGEIPISIRTAELLAKKLLQLNVSTILDLSELKHSERITFVKRFLDSLINSPKELWHPLLVIIDEAHVFCPEGAKSESASSVIDLATRGRKRGFSSILATQRISKLSKDAAAELNNVMTGRTGLDIDQQRAGVILGFTSKEDTRKLRDLKSGEFHCFGPAFSHNGVEKFTIGDIKTTHPDRTKGVSITKPSPTPDNIKKLLKKVIDLPKEAEEELKTKEDMQRKIRELKTKLTIAEKQKVNPIVKSDEKALQKAQEQGFKEAEMQYKQKLRNYERDYFSAKKEYDSIIKKLEKKLSDIGLIVEKDIPKVDIKFTLSNDKISLINKNILKPLIKEKIPNTNVNNESVTFDDGYKVTGGAMRILKASASFYPNPITKPRAGAISGLSYKSGTFGTYIATLKKNGLIEVNHEGIIATEEGLNKAGNVEPIPSDSESLVNMWCNIIKGGASRMLRVLADNYPNRLTKEELGSETDLSASSGTFGTYLSTLKRNGLIEVNNGSVKIAEEFFN